MTKSLIKTSFLISFILVLACTCALCASQGGWQSGRIVEVRKTVDSKPIYWLVNTPVTKNEITYTIAVHLGQKILVGVYTLDRLQGAPPDQWVRGRPVKVQLDVDNMYLKPLSGDEIKLRIVKRKSAPPMQPVTDSEMKEAYALPAQTESLIGFADSAPKNTAAESKDSAERSEAEAPPAMPSTKPPSGPVGVIDVTTVPYLAEIFVDGASVGYSPAKFTLSIGTHALRVQKDGYQTWSKDVNVLENSEFTVSAELKKK
jgi:PEGA domain